MPQTTPNSAPSIASLRIDASKRGGSPIGKWLGIGAAILGLVVIALGSMAALRSRKA